MNGYDTTYCPCCTYPVAYPPTIRRPVICPAHTVELREQRRLGGEVWRSARKRHEAQTDEQAEERARREQARRAVWQR